MKAQSLLPLTCFALLTLGSSSSPAAPWVGNTMESGIAALTCTSSGLQTVPGLQEHVLALIDIRDAVGSGGNPINVGSGAWFLTPSQMYFPAPGSNDWSVANLGEVFGVDVGVGSVSHVYLAAMGLKPGAWSSGIIWANRPYNTSGNNTGTGGEVWRIHGVTHIPFLLARLPNHKGVFTSTGPYINGNSFVGLGQVSVNTKPGISKVYVSNLDDGKIYTLTDGIFNSTYPCPPFDHGTTKPGTPLVDDPNQLYTQTNRMVMALEYHPQLDRLFYVLRNAGNQDEVWSVGLDAVGCPTGVPCLEFASATWSATTASASLPSDIQFSADGCRMLISHVSVVFDTCTVTGITGSPTFTGPSTQFVPFHYAHTSAAYEAKFNGAPTCIGGPRWLNANTNINRYHVGNPIYSTPANNCVAGDYGYGNVVSTKAIDSVVFVADVIRPLSPTYHFGLEIHPLDDLQRTMLPSANFDVPINLVTKIQLNDVDILHENQCAKIVASAVVCPVGNGSPPKVTITITNTSNTPFYGLGLSNCPGMPLPPGATPISPIFQTPPNININNPLMPGQSTGPLVVCLPGVPPPGGVYCFCVTMALGEVEGAPVCTQMVCVNVPPCLPPCATLTAQNIICDPLTGNYQFNLCITNLQPTPITSVKFSTPGAGPLPSPNPFTLPNPLPNGGTACYPFTLAAPFTAGGQYCFDVTLCGDPKPGDTHPQVLCLKQLCLNLPPCVPPCVTLTYANVQCPQVQGGAYTFNLIIQNLSAQPISFITLGPCTNPPQGCTVIVPPGGPIAIPGGPLLPGNTAVIPISLPGLPCTGMNACINVTVLTQGGGGGTGGGDGPTVLCQQTLCVHLPECPCPPCMSVQLVNVACPTLAGGAYTVTFKITNLGPTPLAYFNVYQCAVPPGYNQALPVAGTTLIPGGPLAQNQISGPITVQVPAPLTGGNYCFCVGVQDANQQTQLCEAQLCFTLPGCRCAEIIGTPEVICLPNGTTQLTFVVANNSQLTGAPFNFNNATFSPGAGFTPSFVTTSPNPIPPGGVGTVSTVFTGPAGLTCVNVVMANNGLTRCCTVRLCFNNPYCTSVRPDACDLAPQFTCVNGIAVVTTSLNNNSNTPKSYTWTFGPVAVAGCTATLPPAAFTPASGTTFTVGANSSVVITTTVNTASIPPGQCAGFRFCFQPAVVFGELICCTSKIYCPATTDPCIEIGHGLNVPVIVRPDTQARSWIGIPIRFTNPTAIILTTDLVPHDTSGTLAFSLSPGSDSSADIDEEAPFQVSLAPGEVFETMLYAASTSIIDKVGVGTISIGRPCIGIPFDRPYFGTTPVIYGTGAIASGVPLQQSVSSPSTTDVAGMPAVRMIFRAQPGVFYHVQGSSTLNYSDGSGFVLAPSSSGLIVLPDGSFTSLNGDTLIDLPHPPATSREFYRFSTGASSLPLMTR